jgi:uncharacterized membrane protein YcaP (DUF421 family)
MDAVIRAVLIYFFVWLMFRIAGKRTLAEATTFDFVLLLIISEATQQGLLGQDFSVTNACLVITTLVGLDIAMSLLKRWSPRLERMMDGQPLILVDDGRVLTERMHRARVDENDILEAARRLRGLERLDQIRFAVLEQSGGITIVPKSGGINCS